MKDLVIFGISEFAEQMKYYIDNDDTRSVVAFCVDDEYYQEGTVQGLPIIKFSELNELYPPNNFDVLLAIGYKKMNQVRRNLFKKVKNAGYSIASFIHSSCLIQAKKIGEGNIILEQTLIEPFVEIGDGNLIYCRVCIAHNDVIENFNTIAGMASVAGFAKIGNNCFIGNSACIRDGINIADFTLIGASAYISRDTNEYDVVRASFSVTSNKKSTEYEL